MNERPDHIIFLAKLRQIDKLRVTPRDVIIMFIIISKPGLNGGELKTSLNLANRSGIAVNVRRLIDKGLIEDRRDTSGHLNSPNILYITEKGKQLWESLKKWE